MKRLHLKDAIPQDLEECDKVANWRLAALWHELALECLVGLTENAQQSNRPTIGKDGT